MRRFKESDFSMCHAVLFLSVKTQARRTFARLHTFATGLNLFCFLEEVNKNYQWSSTKDCICDVVVLYVNNFSFLYICLQVGIINMRDLCKSHNPRRGRQHSFVEIDHEIFSTVILSLPLIQEGQLSVSGERMCTVLVNR